jgi:hypothetical protein
MDGLSVFRFSDDEVTRQFDITLLEAPPHRRYVSRIAGTRDGKLIACLINPVPGYSEGAPAVVVAVSLDSREKVAEFVMREGAVLMDIAFSPDGAQLSVGGTMGLRLFDCHDWLGTRG